MNVIKWLTHESTASFSHECILLASYVYNMHQNTKSGRLMVVYKRTLTPDDFIRQGRASGCKGYLQISKLIHPSWHHSITMYLFIVPGLYNLQIRAIASM